MSTKTLKSFARKQASAEQAEAAEQAATETTAAESTETESTAESTAAETTGGESTETESSADSTEESESTEETESTAAGETESGTDASASTGNPPSAELKPGMIAVNASELKALQEKAAKWDANEGKLKTLQAWYDNTIKVGAMAKEDISTTSDRGASKVASQPWNQAAREIAERYHS
ncbi:hypothetical protein ACO2Q8_16685 [Larkinella sp. VNQ87]|uniref:hypothetical protein n=1 Tax=Larkinella sp. VNQ87 TaxID=3400921 RepID=UPI003BFB90D2